MDGGAGGDKLLGGNGSDQLTGGLGADRFVFTAIADSPAGAGADHITDFNSSQGDKIDLSAIDANIVAGGDQGFSFIGNQPFHGVVGELHYVSNGSGITVEGDVNGDGVTDFAINVNGVASIASSDFIL